VALMLQSELRKKSMEEAWNDNMIELVSCSRVHIWHFILNHFMCVVDSHANHPARGVHQMLHKLCSTLAIERINEEMSLFLQYGYMSGDHLPLIKRWLVTSCRQLRDDAVALVDALNFPDFVLKSPLGCHDGDIYNKYFKMVNEAPMSAGVAPYWAKHIAPLVQSAKL